MNFVLAVDFDGTIFSNSYPNIKNAIPRKNIINKIKKFKRHGAEIILWTCREGVKLKEAISKAKEVGLEFDAINENAPCEEPFFRQEAKKGFIYASRKVYADFYLDDKSYNIGYFLKLNVERVCKKVKERKKEKMIIK